MKRKDYEKLRSRLIVKTILALLKRAGWAPVLVFTLHVLFSRAVDVYMNYRWSDVPMHYFGGIAMAYFLSTCFAALPEGIVSRKVRPYAQLILVASLTVTAAVFWEFCEYASDSIFKTNALGNVYDTLQDLALGTVGGITYLILALLLGRLGRVRPIES